MDREKIERLLSEQPPFGLLLGTRFISATADEVIAEFEVTPQLANRNGVLHGGAIMGFADGLGGVATMINMPDNVGTTTTESKTNFFRPVRLGEVARGVCIPLHRGRKLQVWQTSILRADGKLAAMVTQSQIILEWEA